MEGSQVYISEWGMGMTVVEYTRHLELDGGLNVRDLGGYRSGDGRKVKWRKILRSGHLSHLEFKTSGSCNPLTPKR